ncbi:MAG: putative membrane protein YphA (DoxX/SURF4 family) [Bacteroidia bacterium]|jgi:uncharacterized membrane protein YphA (DoxX/SURF4 family)
MRYIVHFSRILLGLYFIYSGLVKLDDPTGFSYKLDEYFTVFAGDLEAAQDSVVTQISYADHIETNVAVLKKTDSISQLTILQSPWTLKDSVLVTTIDVYQNGETVFTETITTQDSLFSLGKLLVESSVNDESLTKANIDLKNIGQTPEAQSVESDVSSYIKVDNWAVGLFNWLRNYALFLAIFVSWLEAILGFAVLIGWQPKFSISSLILLTLFFTFLTLYSWMYDKVTDCGCFGDAIPMTPKESFYKNIISLIVLAIAFFGRKHIKPIFSNSFGVKVLTVLTLMLVGFSLYCKNYLPVVDFLHYSEGTDIREGMKVPEGKRSTDHIQSTYLYKSKENNLETITVVYDSDKNSFEPKIDYSKWAYDKVVDEKLIEKAHEPEIHDFAFYNADQDNNYIEDFWLKDKKLLLVMHDVNKANPEAIKEIREIAKQWTEDGNEFWALTASPREDVEVFRHDNQISEFDFYYGDNTNLKSIIRSNPGLLLITDTSVVRKVWPSTRLPKYKKILRKSE